MARTNKEDETARLDQPDDSPVTDIVRKLSGVSGSGEAEPVEYVNPFSGEVSYSDEGLFKRTDLDALDFSSITTADLIAVGRDLGLTESDISALVDRWPLFDKAKLERDEVPLTFFQWKFGQGSFAKDGEIGYVMIWARREDTGEQGTIYDGSTGIKEQMKALTARRRADGKPMYNFATISRLTRSDYETENGPATTYYLS